LKKNIEGNPRKKTRERRSPEKKANRNKHIKKNEKISVKASGK
jgi:hypothetical protein